MKKLVTLVALIPLLVSCAGNIPLSFEVKNQILAYQCNGIPLVVVIDNVANTATLLIEKKLKTLKQVKTASGNKYELDIYGFWSIDNEAMVFKNNASLVSGCRLKTD